MKVRLNTCFIIIPGWTALLWASLTGRLAVVEWLVTECQQPADYTTDKGETPLMKAASNGHAKVCKFLIDQGAKVKFIIVFFRIIRSTLMMLNTRHH
jgi:ankyrin repeat protein